MVEAAATAFASILVLGTGFGLGGYVYHKFYKWLVLYKMERAFKPGDPVLELAAIGKQMPNTLASGRGPEDDDHWIVRDEQAKVDRILNGTDRGHYHLLIGEKGTGKSSMLLEAMQKVDGEGVSSKEHRLFDFSPLALTHVYSHVTQLLPNFHRTATASQFTLERALPRKLLTTQCSSVRSAC
jgi:hypothetical protein